MKISKTVIANVVITDGLYSKVYDAIAGYSQLELEVSFTISYLDFDREIMSELEEYHDDVATFLKEVHASIITQLDCVPDAIEFS